MAAQQGVEPVSVIRLVASMQERAASVGLSLLRTGQDELVRTCLFLVGDLAPVARAATDLQEWAGEHRQHWPRQVELLTLSHHELVELDKNASSLAASELARRLDHVLHRLEDLLK